MDRLEELLKKRGPLTPLEEEEGNRLYAEKHGIPHTPRVVITDEMKMEVWRRIRKEAGLPDEKPWEIKFMPEGEPWNPWPFVYVAGDPLGPYRLAYSFPEDWENYRIPEDKKHEIRQLFDAHIESRRAPKGSHHHWETRLRGSEGEWERFWSQYECRW